MVTPPYPNKLSDYGNPNLLKMSATITAADPSFTSKPIRLKLSIFYNQQLLMQGNDMVVGERPMYLTMGQMLILTQADLAPYFQQQNMRVSPVQYSQTLREGFYQFQLDILDYYTLQKIGLPLVTSIYIMRYDPPLLYKPDNKSVLMDKGQGLVQFQWNPRQIAPNTEYEFTIVELQQEKFVDPAIEFTARRDGSYHYKTTTRMNTLNYGMMGEMPLRWGKSYAWQVRAMTREGIDQVGTYEQDGYTDIRWFTYQKYCPTPTNIEVDVKNSTEATYTWDAAPEHTSYILKITAADNPEHRWLSVYPQEAKFEETQYRPDITYFYKLQGVCGEGVTSEESGERSFTMLPKGQIKNYKCNEGDGTESTGFETIANQKLLDRDLQVGDTFTYSNWCKIKVTTVEKVGGYYKGKGVYRFPLAMFGFPLINIIFDSITVNTELVALSGGFDAVNRGMAGVADIDEAMNVGRDLVSNVQGIVQDVKQLVEDVKQELNALLATLQTGKKPTVEELETAKKDIDNLVVEGKKTLEELKKNPEENKEQIAKMEEAITKLESCSKCVDDHAKANKEEEQKKKEEATAKPGPNRYEIYNAYAIAAAECNLKEEEIPNALNAIKENNFITISVEEFLTRIRKANTDKKKFKTLLQDIGVFVEQKSLYKNKVNINGNSMEIGVHIEKISDIKDTVQFTANELLDGAIPVLYSMLQKSSMTVKGDNATMYIYVDKEENIPLLKTWLLGSYTVSIETMQAIFPNTKKERLEEVLTLLNENMNKFGINTPLRFAHFIAQVGHESGEFNNMKKQESSNYSANRIKEIFGIDNTAVVNGKSYWQHSDLFEKYGVDNILSLDDYTHPIDKKARDTISMDSLTVKSKYVNSTLLFNYVYSKKKGTENGVAKTGDGYKYRGRGIMQMTNRASYRAFTEWYNKNYPEDKQDFLKNPDLILDVKYGVFSALWEYGVDKKGLNKLADENNDLEIGKIINGSGKKKPVGYEDRQRVLVNTKKILNIK
ncbi:MAG: hypothetical protein ACRCUS_07990 [Anaerovoracaceae bacterium]